MPDTPLETALDAAMDHGVGLDIRHLTSFGALVDLLIALILLGIFAMALVQLGKALPGLGRSTFQRRFIRKWIAQQIQFVTEDFNKLIDPRKTSYSEEIGEIDADSAMSRLATLALPGAEGELYDLPRENMIGQINAALQVVLDRPKSDFVLFCIFCRSAGMGTLLVAAEDYPMPAQPAPDTPSEALHLATTQAQRSLDAIQVRLGRLWRRYLTIWSVALGVAIFTALGYFDYRNRTGGGDGLIWWDWAFWIVGGAVGGYLGTVVRDFAVMIESQRRQA
jgi:hypothetical protein